jgi:hypothetical protein
MSFFRNLKREIGWKLQDAKYAAENIKDGSKEIFTHLASGPSMIRAVGTELKRDVKDAWDEEILNKPALERRKLKRGDIIGISRGVYEHFGIYFGYDQVIHYTSLNPNASAKDNKIIKTTMSNFLRGTDYIFIVHDDLWSKIFKPYSAQETIERAKSLIGQEDYSLFFNNCEHFAFWCKLGVKKCTQGLTKNGRIYVEYTSD